MQYVQVCKLERNNRKLAEIGNKVEQEESCAAGRRGAAHLRKYVIKENKHTWKMIANNKHPQMYCCCCVYHYYKWKKKVEGHPVKYETRDKCMKVAAVKCHALLWIIYIASITYYSSFYNHSLRYTLISVSVLQLSKSQKASFNQQKHLTLISKMINSWYSLSLCVDVKVKDFCF